MRRLRILPSRLLAALFLMIAFITGVRASGRVFQNTIVAGLDWTGGRVAANLTPNVDRVAPGARQLPPLPPDAK